jgi:hypothetical protein
MCFNPLLAAFNGERSDELIRRTLPDARNAGAGR